ncbi:MAG TPA: flagellar biosynthetic protein FliR, partial [Rhabdochlamydiaceae bacterium]
PSGVKIGTAIALTAIILPYLISHAKTPIVTYDALFACYCLKELFIGLVIAFLVGIPFYIMQSSGVLIDFLRGSSALQIQDPVMQSQSSSIGQLYNYVFIVLFYDIGGPFIFLEGVLNSYSIIPADSFIPVAFFNLQLPFWQFMMGILTKFLALSLQLAAPSIVAILMAEMFLGIANRLAPQVQIAFLGMALKSFIGLGLLWAAWYFILQQIGKQSILWLQTLNQLIFSIPK